MRRHHFDSGQISKLPLFGIPVLLSRSSCVPSSLPATDAPTCRCSASRPFVVSVKHTFRATFSAASPKTLQEFGSTLSSHSRSYRRAILRASSRVDRILFRGSSRLGTRKQQINDDSLSTQAPVIVMIEQPLNGSNLGLVSREPNRWLRRAKLWFERLDRKYDVKRMVPTAVMYFTILFVYTIIRDIKDVLIVTAKMSGAEAIPFLRTWFVVPSAFISMLGYSILSDKVPHNKLFMMAIVPFLAFFLVFSFVLYPLRNIIHPYHLATWFHAALPPGIAAQASIVCSWSFVLFFLASELWGSLIFSMGFWGFANEVFSLEEAKRVYPLLGVTGNIPSLFVGGAVVKYIAQSGHGMGAEESFTRALKQLMVIVAVCGVLIISMIVLVNRAAARAKQRTVRRASKRSPSGYVASLRSSSNGNGVSSGDFKAVTVTDVGVMTNGASKGDVTSVTVMGVTTNGVSKGDVTVMAATNGTVEASGDLAANGNGASEKRPARSKMSVFDGIRFLAQSPYLRNLGLLVVCYGVSISLVETFWKSSVKQLYMNPNDYSEYMGEVEMITAAATVGSTALCSWMLRHFGWGATAHVTPAVTLLAGVVFMAMALTSKLWSGLALANGIQPLYLICTVGTLQLAVSHACKYSLFDVTKEMVFIPLDRESKSKGKAAIDVLGQVLGKSGGALFLQLCVAVFGNLATAAPAITVIFTFAMVACIYSVVKLDEDVRPLWAAQAEKEREKELLASKASQDAAQARERMVAGRLAAQGQMGRPDEDELEMSQRVCELIDDVGMVVTPNHQPNVTRQSGGAGQDPAQRRESV